MMQSQPDWDGEVFETKDWKDQSQHDLYFVGLVPRMYNSARWTIITTVNSVYRSSLLFLFTLFLLACRSPFAGFTCCSDQAPAKPSLRTHRQ